MFYCMFIIRVLTNAEVPFNVIYDFIFDRLRAVRQDLVIQRIENEDAIILLETIVKFHIYADFR
jgi:SAC3 domain-containing protein 1